MVFMAAEIFIVWVWKHKCRRKKTIKKQAQEMSSKLEMANLAPVEVQEEVQIHRDRLEDMVKSHMIPMVNHSLATGTISGMGERGDPMRALM